MGHLFYFRPFLTTFLKNSRKNQPISFYNQQKEKVNQTLLLRTALFLVAILLFTTKIFAQTVVLPSEDRCTSKDLSLVSARLDVPLCQTCSEGQTVTAPLLLAINNTTSSTRTSFAFWGTLVVKNADGTTASSTYLTGCNGPIPKNTITEMPFSVVRISGTGTNPISNTGQITYTCGQSLDLTGLFLAWTDASPKSTCESLQPSLIAPKCGTLPSISISTGLTVTGIPNNISCFGANNGAINLTVNGGKPPYNIDWADLPGTSNPEDRTGLGPGTYNVTVTDANNCVVQRSFTITQPNEVVRPTVTVVQPSLCGPATGTVTVTAPTGTNYEYSKDGGTTWQSSTVFSGLAAGAGFSIIVRDKTSNCVSPATNCSNYLTASTAAIRSVKAPDESVQTAKAETELTAFPIPFSDRTTLEFKSVNSEDYVINLYDLGGNLVKQLKSGKAKAGEITKVEVDGRGMAESMYLVRKVSKTGVSTVKLLKKK